MFISAGNKEIFSFALPIGVGLLESSMNLTRLILFNRPEYLIFIGSAGSYGNLDIFELFETSSATNIEHCMLKNKCYTPIDNFITFSQKKEIIVNSSNYITTSKKISKKYLNMNIDAENMEFFSVLKVAKEFNIPVKGIFVISNFCSKDAHKEYENNINKVNSIIVEYIKEKHKIT